MKHKRIYVVVAETVEDSLRQPAGRLGAQVGHVVSKMRYEVFRRELLKNAKRRAELLRQPFEPVTTIVLGARDSEELRHVLRLLMEHRLPVHYFFDTQPDYVGALVMTAICTEPMEPRKVEGILDYLPLWTPDKASK